MIKPKFEISRWARWRDISFYGMGGFHLGPFIDWEPWAFKLGVDLGFWCLSLEFEIPYSEERKQKLLAHHKREEVSHGRKRGN